MIRQVPIAVALLLVAAGSAAHHSSAMFDTDTVVEVSATVKEFQWTNPHVWIEIYVRNDAGEQEQWSVEYLGPNSLFRQGWRPNSFQPGDMITIRIHPMRDGSNAGFFVGAEFDDGHTLGNWN